MRRFVIFLFFLAFAIRLATVWFFHDVPQYGDYSGDDDQFHTFAVHLAQGQGYVNAHGEPTSFRAPGFPLLLALIYTTFGVNLPAVFVVMALLGAVGCVLTFTLARELVSEFYARLAGVLAALYLPYVFFATTVISENLFVPLFALGLWLFIRHVKTRQWLPLCLAGLTFGFASLTRPYLLLLLPIYSVILLAVYWRSFVTLVKAGFIYGLPFLAVMTPWTIRNADVHGHFVATSTNGGSTFYGGNNDLVLNEPKHWGYWVSTTELPGRALIDAQPNEYAHDKMEWKLGKEWVAEHWTQMPLLWTLKLARLWWLPELGSAARVFRVACYLPFLILIVSGWIRMLRHRIYWSPSWWVLHGAMLATYITAMIFCGIPRFRDANLPILMITAVVGWQGIRARFGANSSTPVERQSSGADLPQTKSPAETPNPP